MGIIPKKPNQLRLPVKDKPVCLMVQVSGTPGFFGTVSTFRLHPECGNGARFEGLLEYGGLSEGFRRIIVGFDSTARWGLGRLNSGWWMGGWEKRLGN